jgi:hypothetical protein
MIEGKFAAGRVVQIIEPHQAHFGPAAAGFQRMAPSVLHINESNIASRIMGPKTSTAALGAHPNVNKAHRNYQWLKWVAGFVSEVPQMGVDVLTGPMSGCWVTRYSRGGMTCVGHVGTESSAVSANSVAAKAAWNAFRATPAGAGATGFNPFRYWTAAGGIPGIGAGEGPPKVFALVTSTGQFYSIFTFPIVANPGMVRVAGISPPIASNLPVGAI